MVVLEESRKHSFGTKYHIIKIVKKSKTTLKVEAKLAKIQLKVSFAFCAKGLL